jgi:hypothetical protein
MAAVIVLLLGFSLLLLTSVVVFRAVVQAGATSSDARWEQALYVAESGLNFGGLAVSRDDEFDTGETAPSAFEDREAERSWAVAAADARPDADLVPTPEGEFVLIRPQNSETLYSVGFVPSRDDPNRRVRVVSADVDTIMVPGPWTMMFAFLTGGDLEISGSQVLISSTGTGLHTNGSLYIGGTVTVDGCVEASGSYTQSGVLIQGAGCPQPGGQPLVDIPDVSPRQFWHLSQYDLCPSGAVRAGPAHPTFGNTVTNVPCSGNVLVSNASTPYRGWKFNGCCDSKLGATWTLDSDSPPDGIYYVYRGSVEMSKNPGTATIPWRATILVEGQGSCTNIVGGDVYLSGNPAMSAHPGGHNLTIIAGRDLEISGNPDMRLVGIIAAYEQIKLNGNPSLQEGGYLAQEACDSSNDNIHETLVSGNFTVTNTGELQTPFAGVVPEIGLGFWDEL